MQPKICTYGHPVLRAKAQPITLPDDDLNDLSAEMLVVMHAKRGVGLAAPQIGIDRQICVISFEPEFDAAEPDGPRLNPDVSFPLILINPLITKKKGRQTDTEGCLSVPEIWAPITRAQEVVVTYEGLDGKKRELTARGFLARVIQHELDHLNGVLFIDRMSPARKIGLAGELKRMSQNTKKQLNLTKT